MLSIIYFISKASFLWASSPSIPKGNEEGKIFASEMNEHKIGNLGQLIDPHQIPSYRGEDVEAKKFYKSGVKIEEEAKKISKHQEYAQYLYESNEKRPAFTIDQAKDPLFKRFDQVQNQAHSLTQEYKGCQDLPVGLEDRTQYSEKACFEYGRRERTTFQCERTLEVHCQNQEAGEKGYFSLDDFSVAGPSIEKRRDGYNFLFGSDGNNRFGHCQSYVNTITFTIKNLEEILEFMVAYITYDDWAKIELNGHEAFSERITTCERNQAWGKPSIELKPFLRVGQNILKITNTVQGGGRVLVNLKAVKRFPCHEKNDQFTSCPGGKSPSSAGLEGIQCVEGPGTRIIRGLSIFRDCWKWKDEYSELSPAIYTKDQLCLDLIQQGCGPIKVDCLEQEESYCRKRVLSYSCPQLEAAKTVRICGEDLTCPDGGCTKEYQEYKPATEDFKKAGTSLEVAKAILQETSKNQLALFKGTPKKCKKNVLNFKDCCKDSGWGMDLNLAKCSSEEKELGISKEHRRVHFVGDYKSGGFIDKRKYFVYCVYPSKLARIIVEQGKNQQQKGFGKARSPDCSGFTFEELEALDFNKMEFSEFYDDVMIKAENSQLPNIDETIQKIKESLAQKISAKKEGSP